MAISRSSSTSPAAAASDVLSEGSASPLVGRGDAGRPLIANGLSPSITEGAPEVEIRVSSRRRKTASAFYEAGRIVVLVPARMPLPDQEAVARRLVNRLLHQTSRQVNSDAALKRRSGELSARYLGGVQPSSVRWVDNQERRWASCTPSTGQIRMSSRLQVVPSWVLDAVLVHELAHLLEASHSPRFQELADRYPRRIEADAFLGGYVLGRAIGNAPQNPSAGDDQVLGDDLDHGAAECGAGSTIC